MSSELDNTEIVRLLAASATTMMDPPPNNKIFQANVQHESPGWIKR